jgi:cell wall-associated NlpC family hydrolase
MNGCSSSSYNERYNRPKDKDIETRSSSVRFTSKDDPNDKEVKTDQADISQADRSDTTTSYADFQQDEFDETPKEDYSINTEEFVEKYSKLKQLGVALTPREKILFEVVGFLETPYKYGGTSSNGIDCSSFTQNVFKNSLNVFIPRTAREQFKFGEDVSIPEKLKFGDLVFFNTSKKYYPGHVGIYLGDDLFAHASRSLGVTVSSLKGSYYLKRYVGARRILKSINEN